LVRDIGAALGCGAHLNQLRRLKSGRFHVDACCSLDQLKAEGPVDRLLSLDQALADLASVPVEDEAIAGLCHGIPPERDQVKLDNGVKEGDLVRLSTCDGLVAVACYAPQRDKEKRGDFKLVRVFCPPKSLYSDR
jgi:tRNA pseudouridine55 synthase